MNTIDLSDAAGRRFLHAFALVVMLVTTVVVGFNLLAFRQVLRPENQAIVQLIGGWSRVYKPILFDRFRPQVAVFGASWARDAFDPLTVSELTGLNWFNHAVSASTPYESRRFIDSSLDDPQLEAVVLNLDTFLVPDVAVRAKSGFDETLLDTDPAGQPTRGLAARRFFATTVSGAAIGNNIEVLNAIRARDAGADPSEYLESYERLDFDAHVASLDKLRSLVPGLARAPSTGLEPPLSALPVPPGQPELERVLDSLCRLDIDIYGYYTPTIVAVGEPGRGLSTTLHGLEVLRRYQPRCRARLHLFNFNYPNGVTLDGLERTGRYSEYFRPDGHPRPTIGLLMAARMFGRPYPGGTPAGISADFGVDLLTVPDAEQRLRDQAGGLQQLFAGLASVNQPAGRKNDGAAADAESARNAARGDPGGRGDD